MLAKPAPDAVASPVTSPLTQRTVSLIGTLGLYALSLAAAPLAAQTIERMKMSDGDLTCAQIYGETQDMERVAATARQAQQSSQTTATGAGIASQVAPLANAFGGFMGGLGGLFGQAAGTATSQVASNNAQQHAQRAAQADARKEHLTQMFLAKGCRSNDLNFAGNPINPIALTPARAPGRPVAPSAEALRAVIEEPIDLRGIDFSGRTEAMAGGARIHNRVFVPSFRVAFAIKGTVKASQRETYFLGRTTAGQVVTTDNALVNVDFNLMQDIADRAYNDFLDRIEAAGMQLISPAEWTRAPSASQLEWGKRSEAQAPYTVEVGGGYSEVTYLIVTPTGIRNWPETSMPSNLSAIRGLARELNATMLVPRYVLNYAVQESSGGGGTLFARREVSTSVKPMLHGGASGGGFSFDPAGVRLGEHGGAIRFKADRPFAVESRFGELREIKGNDPYAAANALSTAIWTTTNLGATFRQKNFYAMEADPAAYARAALRVLAMHNAATVEALQTAR